MTMFNKVTKTFQWGQHTVTLETGEIARQATGAVLVNIDDKVTLMKNGDVVVESKDIINVSIEPFDELLEFDPNEYIMVKLKV